MSEERSEAAEAARERADRAAEAEEAAASGLGLNSSSKVRRIVTPACSERHRAVQHARDLHRTPRTAAPVGMPRRSRVLTAFRGLSALHRHFSERQVRIAFRSGSGKRAQDAMQCSQLVLSKEELR